MLFFHRLPDLLQGVITFLYLAGNTMFWCMFLLLATVFKAIVPVDGWRHFWGRISNRIATAWVMFNNLGILLTKTTEWEARGLEDLRMNGWYLVISNHQSWLDIVVLQKVFARRIPFLKFFLKQQLIWVPLLGQAWWALDFPFMKRYSREYLKKYPERKGKDLETTRRACAKFKQIPVTVMNFVEGSRFTMEKAKDQRSPYSRLLKPKAAGIAFVLGAMGEQLSSILNVTIDYPGGEKSLWAFMCGRVRRIRVVVETIPITPELLGDYFQDKDYQERFQLWVNNLWDQKERLLISQVEAS